MSKHESDTNGCWSRLPVYRAGGRLTAEQLASEQLDTDLRERLLNLALHGTGVVHGFDIRTRETGEVEVTKKGCIHVGCGLALDRWGRTLYTPDRHLGIDQLVESHFKAEGCYTLRVHYAERSDREAWDPCEDTIGWRHRCVVFTLRKGCEKTDNCPGNLPPPSCDPRRTFVCERTGMISNGEYEALDLKEACRKPPELTPVGCDGLRYDPDAGIPLACLAICQTNKDEKGCKPEYGFCVCPAEGDESDGDEYGKRPEAQNVATHVPPGLAGERPDKGGSGREKDDCDDDGPPDCRKPTTCDMRPVAYRAPLLYELINDTDVYLPKVKSYSWQRSALGEWDTRMSLEEFADRVKACNFDHDEKCTDNPGMDEGFHVAFDRPVDKETLHPLSVIMEVYLRENRTNSHGQAVVVNWKEYRVPLLIKPDLDRRDPDCATGFHLCISEGWLEYIIGDIRNCAAAGQLVRVEITLRGQAIRDKCGCMMDAQPVELDCRDHCGRKTGQARPGGNWISTFRVGPEWPAEGVGDDDDDERPVASYGDRGRVKSSNQDEGRTAGFSSSR
ncbi:hypothetical protein DEA8626_03031 [Defluviimonas aquaemixtae]|uniref:Uncharacterized protein n=1 Tax=Albidovulum aquaemixtae TaxID=1542388 RepID=A0A2R8BKV3_9RHOB|nr:hypothetical protein [Defluviimonas aquaemixtae]SPH23954.1 hypothetical protein DEA8626_03031 [Defluviimonas aquaemixtae]